MIGARQAMSCSPHDGESYANPLSLSLTQFGLTAPGERRTIPASVIFCRNWNTPVALPDFRKLPGKLIAVGVLCGVVGVTIGLFVRADGLFQIISAALSPMASEEEEQKEDDPHAGRTIAVVTEEAARSLGLKTAKLKKSDYLKTIRVPGFIVEKPGHSGRTVASRVRGIIREIYCSPGELMEPGDPLFRIELTGDGVVTAQVSLLETKQQIEATKKELARVEGLVKNKTAPPSELIPIQMLLERLEKQGELRRKELLVRGLSDKLIGDILKTGNLRDEFIIRVPDGEQPALDGRLALRSAGEPLSGEDGTQIEPPLPADEPLPERPEEFTVEEINVHPGQSVAPGDQLADLAWHDVLAVEGHAFERDVKSIAALAKSGWKATIEYGAHEDEILVTDLEVKFVDNHVDAETGTFRFFLEIQNEEFHETTDTLGRTFKSWRFKPGQRVHIIIPVEELKDQFVFPREAVVDEGVDSFVFRRISQTADFDEFEAIPVAVLYRDSRTVVVASDGKLRENNRVVLNSAYQLYLAAKADSGSGGHSHPHPH